MGSQAPRWSRTPLFHLVATSIQPSCYAFGELSACLSPCFELHGGKGMSILLAQPSSSLSSSQRDSSRWAVRPVCSLSSSGGVHRSLALSMLRQRSLSFSLV